VIRAMAILVVGLVVACKGTAPADPNGEAPATFIPADPPADACCMADPGPAEPVSAEPAVDEAALTPTALYLQCRERVEKPEADGECKTAADCGASGCGGEVCAANVHGAIMSTCEVRGCFAVLDSCGCVEGKCQWSLKAEVPEGRRITPIE